MMEKQILIVLVIHLVKSKNAGIKSHEATDSHFSMSLPTILKSAKFFLNLKRLPEDIFLNLDQWKEMDQYLFRTNKEMEYNHCSYVDDILNKNYTSSYIEIVISPVLIESDDLSLGQTIRIIFKVPFNDGDKIKLYKKYYKHNVLESSVLSEIAVNLPNLEFVDTDVFYSEGEKYFVEYLRTDGEVVAKSRYYRTKQSWMWCMRHSLQGRLLSRLFLPGTHDSGAYIKPQWWQNLLDITKLYYSYVYTQEDSIFSQLMQGSRYLDLRLGKYTKKNVTLFFINHNPFKVHPLNQILDQIKEFLRINPYEIIVLDLHRFPVGFITQDDHDELAQYLIFELGDLIYRHPRNPTWEITIDQMWKTNGRIIIAYNNKHTGMKYKFFPGINQLWGEKDELPYLISFLDENIPRNCENTSSSMISAMTELTPTLMGIAGNKYKGLRGFANITNTLITHNFIHGTWGDAVQAVAVDFLSSTGIVTAAIIQNALRAQEGHICH